jgi:hypothetical protein
VWFLAYTKSFLSSKIDESATLTLTSGIAASSSPLIVSGIEAPSVEENSLTPDIIAS